MSEEKNTVPVIRERKNYKPFEIKKPRLRNSCPKCGSLDVKKRKDTYDYVCGRCRWEGEVIMKVYY
jgi:predicted RNA-binding Zn-ribbon protein involved in translation (DUF1610 family)